MSSTRRRVHVFPGQLGPGFSPSAIVPNIAPRFNCSGFPRCTAPAKTRRSLRIVVSTLSQCAFFRALAYDMQLLVRCRRWKPMIRRRSLRCALWSTAKCSSPRVHFTHPYSSVSHHQGLGMRTFSVNEAVSISHSTSLNRSKHAHTSGTGRLISDIVSAVSLIRSPRHKNCTVWLYP